MKKRVSAGVMITMLMAATVFPAYAADNMEVQYSQNTTYMLSIPASITLSANDPVKAENIGLSKVNAAPDKKVQVKIKSGITNSKVELARKDDTETKVVSTVTDKDGSPVSDGFVVAEFAGTSDDPAPIVSGTGVLNFSRIEDNAGSAAAIKAGSYTGTIVFEGAIVSPNP